MEEKNQRIRMFCFGELGKMFYDIYGNELGERFSFVPIQEPNELQSIKSDYPDSKNEKWMLITEYEPQIWKKYLEDKQIQQLLTNVELKFIINHPKNNIIPLDERRLIHLMGLDFDAGKIILAMPDSDRKMALETVCATIFDLLGSIYKSGYITFDYEDLFMPGHYPNWYGMIYHGNSSNTSQLIDVTRGISEQIRKEIAPKDILYAILIMTMPCSSTLSDISKIAGTIEEVLSPDDTAMIWGHISSETECGVTLVLYRKLKAE